MARARASSTIRARPVDMEAAFWSPRPPSPTPSSSRSQVAGSAEPRSRATVTSLPSGSPPVALGPALRRHPPAEPAPPAPVPPPLRRLESDLDVLAGGERPEQFQALEGPGQPEPGPMVGLHLGDIGVEQMDRAPAGSLQSTDHIEQGGLAGAVGTDQPGDRPGPDGEAHVAEGGDAAEPDRHLRHGQGARTRPAGCSSAGGTGPTSDRKVPPTGGGRPGHGLPAARACPRAGGSGWTRCRGCRRPPGRSG